MDEHVAIREFLQDLAPGNLPQNVTLSATPKLCGEFLQPLSLWPVSEQPIFAFREFMLELRECPQPKPKPFK